MFLPLSTNITEMGIQTWFAGVPGWLRHVTRTGERMHTSPSVQHPIITDVTTFPCHQGRLTGVLDMYSAIR